MEQMNFKLMAENYKLLTEQNKIQKELLELAKKGEKHMVDRTGGSSTSRNNSSDTQ